MELWFPHAIKLTLSYQSLILKVLLRLPSGRGALLQNTEETMAWNTPEIEEVTCGMEINMYFPAEDEGELF